MWVPSDISRTLAPNERLMGLSLLSRVIRRTFGNSYRHCVDELNESLHREGENAFSSMTICNLIERYGTEVNEAIKGTLSDTLTEHGIDPITAQIKDPTLLPIGVPFLALEKLDTKGFIDLKTEIEEINLNRVEEERLTDLKRAVAEEGPKTPTAIVSIDSVYSSHQKEKRNGKPDRRPDGSKPRCGTAVVHIQIDNTAYMLTTDTTDRACAMTLGFLLKFHLLDNRALVFLSDGAKDIKAGVAKWFSHWNYRLILDWFHLKKRCYECLSMALVHVNPKDKEAQAERDTVVRNLLRQLWVGNVDEAVEFLSNLPSKMIKNRANLVKLQEYLMRKKTNVGCYAIRRKRKLRISSNPVEKSNDLVVSSRQKHNGMSWCYDGSLALAQLTALFLMDDLDNWLVNRTVSFAMKEIHRHSGNDERIQAFA